MRACDHAIGPGFKGAARAFRHQIGDISGFDQAGVQIAAVQRGQNRHSQDLGLAAGRAFPRGAYHMRVAMDGQKIQIELRQTAHRRLYRGTDIEQLHIKENALAVILLQLIGQREAPTGQHPQADLVEAHRITKVFGQLQPLKGVWHIKGNDQSVIRGMGHGARAFSRVKCVALVAARPVPVNPVEPRGRGLPAQG